MENLTKKIQDKPILGWGIFGATLLVVFLIGLLASSITQRKAESSFAYQANAKLRLGEPRNEKWGENFPREFETYYETKDTSFKSKYNGGAMIDMLKVDPRLVVLWAGYGFSKDYNQGRGHVYAVTDLRNTLRTGGPTGPGTGPMPATCWTCKGPDVPRLMKEKGIANFYKGKWADKGHEIVNPIGCADCHDSKTMKLQISRPALKEAFERQGKDVTKANHQDMRSLVCAQCHVEYYFDNTRPSAKGVPYLTFPWDNGPTVEQVEKYYDNKTKFVKDKKTKKVKEVMFYDWKHKLSKAPMLKAQHPGYEIYKMGIHGKRGVSCADCHMPYKTEGGQKFTDHKIQSPLNNIANSCQVCHRESEAEIKRSVYFNQDKIIGNRDNLEKLIVKAHIEAKFAWDKGASKKQMKPILMDIRHAQWRWDYAAASHGGSFHAPVEISRIIGTGIDLAGEARIKLARLLSTLGYNKAVPMPDISTKAKAQKYIGLKMVKLNKQKQSFLKNLLPKWLKIAKAREASWDKKK